MMTGYLLFSVIILDFSPYVWAMLSCSFIYLIYEGFVVCLERQTDGPEAVCSPYAFTKLISRGISSHVLPSRVLPAFFFWTPPHCLKKNGTFAFWH